LSLRFFELWRAVVWILMPLTVIMAPPFYVRGNNIAENIHIIYAVIVWGFLLIYIKPKRVKELLPVALISTVLLFSVEYFLISLKLYKFINPGISIGGIPIFHLAWGAGGGILVMHFMTKKFIEKVLLIVLFALITDGLERIVEAVGAASHLGKFTDIHEIFIDIIMLSTFVWISDSLWRKKIIPKLYIK